MIDLLIYYYYYYYYCSCLRISHLTQISPTSHTTVIFPNAPCYQKSECPNAHRALLPSPSFFAYSTPWPASIHLLHQQIYSWMNSSWTPTNSSPSRSVLVDSFGRLVFGSVPLPDAVSVWKWCCWNYWSRNTKCRLWPWNKQRHRRCDKIRSSCNCPDPLNRLQFPQLLPNRPSCRAWEPEIVVDCSSVLAVWCCDRHPQCPTPREFPPKLFRVVAKWVSSKN